MRTKSRLNWSFAMGSLILAAFIGVVCESGAVFWIALAVLVGLNLANGEIRA